MRQATRSSCVTATWREDDMAADRVKEELAKLIPDRECCRKAELSALLRAEGILHLQGGESSPCTRRARALA